jgi:hypothetical protein
MPLQDYESTLFPIADGGYTDNAGLIAMLRRKVSKILIFYSVASASTDKAVSHTSHSLIARKDSIEIHLEQVQIMIES